MTEAYRVSHVLMSLTLALLLCVLSAPLQAETDDDCGMDLPVGPQTVAVIVGKVTKTGDGKNQEPFTVQVTEKVLQLPAMAKPDPRL